LYFGAFIVVLAVKMLVGWNSNINWFKVQILASFSLSEQKKVKSFASYDLRTFFSLSVEAVKGLVHCH